MAQLMVSSLRFYLGVLAALCVFVAIRFYRRRPRVPSNLPILNISTLSSNRGDTADIEAYEKNGSQVMQHGYNEYSRKGRNYLMKTREGLVFVAAPRFIEEIRTARDDVLSAMIINNGTLQVKYTLHRILHDDWYEFNVIGKQLTQHLGPGLLDIVDECHNAFTQEVATPIDWTSKPMWPIAVRIVTRTANRLLFGEKLAANDDFLQLCINYTYTVFGGAHAIRKYPGFLRPLMLRFKTGIVEQRAAVKKHLAPLFEERIHSMQEAEGTGRTAAYEAQKPKDAVQWVLDITPPEKMDIEVLMYRMIHIIVSAIHTSSVTYLEAIYDLALHPEIHEELRQEIVSVMDQEGKFTKQGLTKMIKMDSLMKESARWHPFLSGTLERQAMRDFKLSDGSIITKGTKVTVPHYAMYFDEEVYGSKASVFDAFRFSKMRTEPGTESKHSFVQCTPTFAHFGYGKNACPGRFFAATEIKVLLVYTLSMFDVRFPKGQPEPVSHWNGEFRMADMSLEVEWKVREQPLLRLDQVVKPVYYE
ncbi:MAG: hypothetical protein M1818_008401 [Claussenomyces sp. TS43310]|nr:MAG: hypothetical protein M1818_008401 [Claussenomyces sp. TS43310]